MQTYPHHPAGEGAGRPLLQLAREHGITPHRCGGCGQTAQNWDRGRDDGTDPGWTGYRCRGCGHVQGLTRSGVRSAIRRAAREDH